MVGREIMVRDEMHAGSEMNFKVILISIRTS